MFKLMLGPDLARREYTGTSRTAGELHDAIWSEFESTRDTRANEKLKEIYLQEWNFQPMENFIEHMKELFARYFDLSQVPLSDREKKVILQRALQVKHAPVVLMTRIAIIENSDTSRCPTFEEFTAALKRLDVEEEFTSYIKQGNKSKSQVVSVVTNIGRSKQNVVY
jgi:hypothetical protein